MARALGGRMPSAVSPHAEALRRLRSFAVAALQRGAEARPALDGLRVDAEEASPVLCAWLDAAVEAAAPDGRAVRDALEPVLASFAVALRSSEGARRAGGAPRAGRRAVSAAIDRVADVFLAIDTESGRIEDANPAAGALLGRTRERLLGASALEFVPEPGRELWWSQLDALAEGSEALRFEAALLDGSGRAVGIEARATRFATRSRTLALVLARPS
jgi:PAS domain S-box-containing protein